MNVMAFLGMLPKSYLQCKTPKCSACVYGKSTRKAWRTKGKYKKHLHVTKEPGECVSVDQMASPTAGFIAQMKDRASFTFRELYLRKRLTNPNEHLRIIQGNME
eukprot:scaffold141825_cov31-Attheya_sp.AAC.3